ncbi:MAG TPA: DUF4382 domain-containing protein [Nevskiaceae bacterium]|nr:DUF4382 domain-containing protein [Nevskiaceae bacterium]
MSKEWLPLIFAAGVLAGCGGGGSDSDSGTLKLAVVDAPIDDAKEVVVSFTAVELLDAGGQVVETIDLNPDVQVDLLQHQGENSFFLIPGETVPAGVYDSVRLITATSNASCNDAGPASYLTTLDDVQHPLIVPSGGSSGFKVKGPITVAAGGTGDYTIDFDLRKSIAVRGNTGCYNLKPVLRVVDNAEIGTLRGTVAASELAASDCNADGVTGQGAAVYVYQGADVIPDDVDGTPSEPLTAGLLTPDGQGNFSYEVGFLLVGSYTVALTCEAGLDDPEADETLAEDPVDFLGVANAAIAVNQDTVVNFPLVP